MLSSAELSIYCGMIPFPFLPNTVFHLLSCLCITYHLIPPHTLIQCYDYTLIHMDTLGIVSTFSS